MPSVSKLSTALASVPNELTVAAANLNLDFSLVKVEAPREYLALGQNLSKKRRRDAEHGSIHVTAGKLAALFEESLPSTPRLVSAYGLRVSEISASPSVNPQESHASFGIFADTVGADATSIWAAATSGPAAVPVHLLACMLARHWNSSEATSIWVEIVSKRRSEIVSAFEDNNLVPFPTLSAARQELNRSHLADWDASARAWLQTADEAYKLQNQQLSLIINNVSLSVDQKLDPYQGVMNAWKSAMATLEALIKGMPQRVQNAATLLALSAWHIYPDILVLGSKHTEVKMTDKLVETGGILTIGLTYESPDREKGIHWALSLAHLRHYGPPTITSKSLEEDSSRISFDQLMLVALGNLVRAWGGSQSDILKTAAWLIVLWEGLTAANETASAKKTPKDDNTVEDFGNAKAEQSNGRQTFAWIGTVARVACHLISAKDLERDLALKLVKCGFRGGRSFLVVPHELPEPYFGLCGAQTLRGVLGIEGHTKLDHFLGKRCNSGAPSPLAVCCPLTQAETNKSTHINSAVTDVHELQRPKLQSGPSRIQEEILPIAFVLEALNPRTIDSGNLQAYFGKYFDQAQTVRHTQTEGDKITFRKMSMNSKLLVRSLHALSLAAEIYKLLPGATVAISVLSTSMYQAFFCSAAEGLPFCIGSGWNANYDTQASIWFQKATNKVLEELDVLDISDTLTLALQQQVKDHHIENDNIVATFSQCENKIRSTAQSIGLNRQQAFSCLALFDSGNLNLRPSALSKVMAMSSGNSIYVASPLLCDPFQVPAGFEMKRIIGNIGRAGIAMLIPPQCPRLRTPNPASWKVVAHEDFNGQRFDGFAQTSVHLSFSGWDQGVGLQDYGLCDTPVFLLESVISVHDRGKWVADVDILAALQDNHPNLRGLSFLSACLSKHKTSLRGPAVCSHPAAHAGVCEFQRLAVELECDLAGVPDGLTSRKRQLLAQKTAIDCWEELLEAPENDCVVRAHGNWLGRLAVACVAYQMGRQVVILPEDVCWKCVEDWSASRKGLMYIA